MIEICSCDNKIARYILTNITAIIYNYTTFLLVKYKNIYSKSIHHFHNIQNINPLAAPCIFFSLIHLI